MKKIEWLNPNKMKFESGYKSFDNFIDSISTGNRIGGGQYSNYIRAYTDVECNNLPFDPGYLREHDIRQGIVSPMPGEVEEFVRANTQVKEVIIYEFYHRRSGQEKRTTLGFVITTTRDDGYKLLRVFNTLGTAKSRAALEECVKYITDKENEEG